MQQKSSRVFPCSLRLPNHFIFSLQGAFCEHVLRPRFENIENNPYLRYIYTQKNLSSGLSSVNTFTVPVLGVWIGNREQEGGESSSGMDGQWSLLEVLPSGLDAFSRWSFSLCLAVCLVPNIGIWGGNICASLVMWASPESCTLILTMVGRTYVPPLTDLRERQGLYSDLEFMQEDKLN